MAPKMSGAPRAPMSQQSLAEAVAAAATRRQGGAADEEEVATPEVLFSETAPSVASPRSWAFAPPEAQPEPPLDPKALWDGFVSNVPTIDWDAVDGLVFDKIWPSRPWSKWSRLDTPGGASHLNSRRALSPRAPPPRRPPRSPSRWEERGQLQWGKGDSASNRGSGPPPTSLGAKAASPIVRAPAVESTEFAVEYGLYAAFAEPQHARALKVRIRNGSTLALAQTLVKRGSIAEDFRYVILPRFILPPFILPSFILVSFILPPFILPSFIPQSDQQPTAI